MHDEVNAILKGQENFEVQERHFALFGESLKLRVFRLFISSLIFSLTENIPLGGKRKHTFFKTKLRREDAPLLGSVRRGLML